MRVVCNVSMTDTVSINVSTIWSRWLAVLELERESIARRRRDREAQRRPAGGSSPLDDRPLAGPRRRASFFYRTPLKNFSGSVLSSSRRSGG